MIYDRCRVCNRLVTNHSDECTVLKENPRYNNMSTFFVCFDCGAVVYNIEDHDRFHTFLDNAARSATSAYNTASAIGRDR